VKVLHAVHGYPPECQGGVESYVSALLAAQKAAGHDVVLLAGSHTPWDETGVEEEEVDGVRVLRLHRDDIFFDLHAKLYHPDVEREFDRILERERPALVHVHQWIRLTCNLVEIAAARGIPSVVTLHDLYVSCPRAFRVRPDDEACFRDLSVESCLDCVPRFGHESERELAEGIRLFHDQYQAELAQAARVVVASPATAELVARTSGFDAERFELLALPYEGRFAATPDWRAPAAGEPLRFGYWGNLTYRKGAQVLVRAFREVARSAERPVELHLFGKIDTDELSTELQELARDLPVHFHGRYEYHQLASAGLHVAVFPMLCFETYGFVLDECFELGLPCIVTDIGAMPARAGAAALRVAPGSVEELARGMAELARSPERAAELRAAIPPASPRMAEHLERLEELYAAAVAEGPRAADPIPAWRRARLLLLQRESAQARLCPPGGPR